jgi:hypothetical protein
VLHLLYNLIVQPNSDRASAFAEMFLDNGGAEMLILLLRREAELGESGHFGGSVSGEGFDPQEGNAEGERPQGGRPGGSGREGKQDDEKDTGNHRSFPDGSDYDLDGARERMRELSSSPRGSNGLPKAFSSQSFGSAAKSSVTHSMRKQGILSPSGRMVHRALPPSLNLNSITLSVTGGIAHTFRNVDQGDGIVIGVVNLLGGLLHGGHLTLNSPGSIHTTPASSGFSTPAGGSSAGESRQEVAVWLMYALQKALEAAPGRLITDTVYSALLLAVLRYETTNKVPGSHVAEERLALYDGGHRFENPELLAALLRVLPVAHRGMQLRAIQDMLLLCCTHVENRYSLTGSPDWPEWVLEILLANDEVTAVARERGEPLPEGLDAVTEMCLSFVSLMLEHSLRIKDGWRDLEAVLHSLEWLAAQVPKLECSGVLKTLARDELQRREKREAAVPGVKRQLFSNLLDFCAEELNDQTGVVAAAAAGVAAGNMSPKNARAEADAAAQLSICLAENALVVLMLLEDFLRTQNAKMTAHLAAAKKEMQSEGGVDGDSVGSLDDEGLPLDVSRSTRWIKSTISTNVTNRAFLMRLECITSQNASRTLAHRGRF